MTGTYKYSNGYELVLSDLAGGGVKLDLTHDLEDSASILIPLEEVPKIQVFFGSLIGGSQSTKKRADRAFHTK